ncbi:hypothetical protein EX895_001549 [Sporisorium graminicola]|uniref:Uncharacterized protein n=1 Tax=Sporisorium graminicola TaxID=280036 RepID=A0A4U7KY34_9BASI|nr:hypothetical protein EX895_001549 [Sporisorium graminicola]TKY89764.1 hypothetical protein EX895_001549 [Sporisorium graminicola]
MIQGRCTMLNQKLDQCIRQLDLRVNEETLTAYLVDMFASAMKPLKAGSASALDTLRKKIKYRSEHFASFDEEAVRSAIDQVLSNDLYAGDKRSNLRDLTARKNVLREIADILNQDLEQLETWQWAEGGVQMSMHRHINGKYRVCMDEEVYQAIFLAHIDSIWSDCFHIHFMRFFDHSCKHGASRKLTKELQRFHNRRFRRIDERAEPNGTSSISHLRH